MSSIQVSPCLGQRQRTTMVTNPQRMMMKKPSRVAMILSGKPSLKKEGGGNYLASVRFDLRRRRSALTLKLEASR
jgi:hypothetical protein